MKRFGVAALAGLLAGLLGACGPSTSLSGSVSELFSLDVSRVEIFENAEALQLNYLANRGVSLDVVVRLGVSLKDVVLKPGAKVSLAGEYEPGHPRATVSHQPGGEPLRLLPRVKRGDLHISSGGAVGEPISGDFSLLFDTDGGDLGQGRTLSGTFTGEALDAGFGPLN